MIKRKYKAILGLTAILIALTALEGSLKFMREYDYTGFTKKEGQGNWYSIAAEAQASNSNCQIELEEKTKRLQDIRKELNPEAYE